MEHVPRICAIPLVLIVYIICFVAGAIVAAAKEGFKEGRRL